LRERVRPGIATGELDKAAEEMIRRAHATSSAKGLSSVSRLDLYLRERGVGARHTGPSPSGRGRHHYD
jgi:hypothetical protein